MILSSSHVLVAYLYVFLSQVPVQDLPISKVVIVFLFYWRCEGILYIYCIWILSQMYSSRKNGFFLEMETFSATPTEANGFCSYLFPPGLMIFSWALRAGVFPAFSPVSLRFLFHVRGGLRDLCRGSRWFPSGSHLKSSTRMSSGSLQVLSLPQIFL